MRFQILRGTHSQREPVKGDDPCIKCNGTGRITIVNKQGDWPCTVCRGTGKLHEEVVYSAKDPKRNIIETDVDLEAKFNGPGSIKFQNLDRIAASPDNSALMRKIKQLEAENAQLKASSESEEEEYDLAAMTVKQLRTFAKEMDIDVEDASNKEELINVISSAMGAA